MQAALAQQAVMCAVEGWEHFMSTSSWGPPGSGLISFLTGCLGLGFNISWKTVCPAHTAS